MAKKLILIASVGYDGTTMGGDIVAYRVNGRYYPSKVQDGDVHNPWGFILASWGGKSWQDILKLLLVTGDDAKKRQPALWTKENNEIRNMFYIGVPMEYEWKEGGYKIDWDMDGLEEAPSLKTNQRIFTGNKIYGERLPLP
jgi:hypothetical protein